jgi:hypothetical protein
LETAKNNPNNQKPNRTPLKHRTNQILQSTKLEKSCVIVKNLEKSWKPPKTTPTTKNRHRNTSNKKQTTTRPSAFLFSSINTSNTRNHTPFLQNKKPNEHPQPNPTTVPPTTPKHKQTTGDKQQCVNKTMFPKKSTRNKPTLNSESMLQT